MEKEEETKQAEAEEKEPEAEKADETPKAEEKEKQSREKDSYYAKLRRQREEAMAEADKLRKENEGYRMKERESVTDEALRNLGITREQLSDPDTMALARGYAEATAKGEENPTAYAYRKLFNDRREADTKAKADAEAKAQADAKAKEETDNAFKELTKAYGRDALKDISDENSVFMKKYGAVVTAGNLNALYGIYKADMKAALDKAKDNGTLNTGTETGKADKKPKFAEDFSEFN